MGDGRLKVNETCSPVRAACACPPIRTQLGELLCSGARPRYRSTPVDTCRHDTVFQTLADTPDLLGEFADQPWGPGCTLAFVYSWREPRHTVTPMSRSLLGSTRAEMRLFHGTLLICLLDTVSEDSQFEIATAFAWPTKPLFPCHNP
eukprot:s2780_g9.t1